MLPFAKITEGDDAGKWKATVRLLGVTGAEQLLTGEIRYADGNPTPTTLKSDLTEALKEFNTGKGESLTPVSYTHLDVYKRQGKGLLPEL